MAKPMSKHVRRNEALTIRTRALMACFVARAGLHFNSSFGLVYPPRSVDAVSLVYEIAHRKNGAERFTEKGNMLPQPLIAEA
jgi:hypothetical protein